MGNKTIEKLLNDIEKFDFKLFTDIQKANMSDDYLLQYMSKIYRHLNDINSDNLEFKQLLKIENNQFVSYEEYSSDLKNKITNQRFISNFLINYGFENIDFRNYDLASIYENFIKLEMMAKQNNINSHDLSKLEKINKLFSSIAKKTQQHQSDKHSYIIINDWNDENFFNAAELNPERIMQYYVFSVLSFLSKQNKRVGIISVTNLFSEIKQSFNNEKNRFDFDVIKNSKSVDFLYLDQLNPLLLSEWFIIDYLIPIIDYRLLNNLTTLIGLNVPIEEFEKQLKINKKNSLVITKELIERIKKFQIIQ